MLLDSWCHVSIIFLTKKALEIFFAFQTEQRDCHIVPRSWGFKQNRKHCLMTKS